MSTREYSLVVSTSTYREQYDAGIRMSLSLPYSNGEPMFTNATKYLWTFRGASELGKD